MNPHDFWQSKKIQTPVSVVDSVGTDILGTRTSWM
jgi:hypothetical protein